MIWRTSTRMKGLPFRPVASWLEPGVSPCGRLVIYEGEISEEQAKKHRRRLAESGAPFADAYEAGLVTVLRVDDEVMMSDAGTEQLGSEPLLAHARGRVLIGGLGLGMVLPELLQLPAVESVTVIEKERALLPMVLPNLAGIRDLGKLEVIVADLLRWEPEADAVWDTIWLDIWPQVTPLNLVDMGVLRGNLHQHLAPGGWFGCWLESELLADLRGQLAQQEPAVDQELLDMLYPGPWEAHVNARGWPAEVWNQQLRSIER